MIDRIEGLRQEARWEESRSSRSAEEHLTIVIEGLKSRNVAETCRKFEIASNLFYRWRDEVEKAALAAIGGRSAVARPDEE